MNSGQQETMLSMATTPTQSDQYWQSVFNKYDKNKDGLISYAELTEIINSQEYNQEFPVNVVDRIMAMADQDNSRNLDFREFMYMMLNPELNSVFGHFVTRYVHTIVPPRHPHHVTGNGHTPEFQMLSTTHSYKAPIRRQLTYGQLYRCWPPAVFIILLTVLETLFYGLDEAEGLEEGNGTLAQALIFKLSQRHQAWRFLTYTLAHCHLVHLLCNLLMQLLLGVPLEMVHGWWRIALVYIAGVALGSLAHSLFEVSPLAGASPGTYAMMTAHIATVIMNWGQMQYATIQLLVFLVVPLVDISLTVYQVYFLHQPSKIAHISHFAGATAGILIGIGVLRNLRRSKWEKQMWLGAMVLYFVLIIVGILGNIFWTAHFNQTSTPGRILKQ